MTYHIPLPLPRQADTSKQSLELHVYTLATPGGHWLKEVTANAAAIAPLIRCGWTVVDVREVGK